MEKGLKVFWQKGLVSRETEKRLERETETINLELAKRSGLCKHGLTSIFCGLCNPETETDGETGETGETETQEGPSRSEIMDLLNRPSKDPLDLSKVEMDRTYYNDKTSKGLIMRDPLQKRITETERETLFNAYDLVIKDLERGRRKTDKIKKGHKVIETVKTKTGETKRERILDGLIEVNTRETVLTSKGDLDPLDLLNEIMVKLIERPETLSNWPFETVSNMVRYIKGSIRKRLITVSQEVFNPVSFFDGDGETETETETGRTETVSLDGLSLDGLQIPDRTETDRTFKRDLFAYCINAKLTNGKDLYSKKEKGLFVRYYVKGETLSEIAERLNRPLGSICKEVSRLSKKLGRLPLRDFYNSQFVSPSGVYFAKHKMETDPLRTVSLSGLKKYRVSKDPRDLERFKRDSRDVWSYHQKTLWTSNLETISPSDYERPDLSFKDPFKSFNSRDIETLWSLSPVYNKWTETGRNKGYSMEVISPLICERPQKIKTETVSNMVYWRGSLRSRPRDSRGRLQDRLDLLLITISKQMENKNLYYVRRLKEYMETLPCKMERGRRTLTDLETLRGKWF